MTALPTMDLAVLPHLPVSFISTRAREDMTTKTIKLMALWTFAELPSYPTVNSSSVEEWTVHKL